MNNREAAIAALLRQGWVPTSRPAPTPIPAPAPTPAPVPAAPPQTERQRQLSLADLLAPFDNDLGPLSTSQQTNILSSALETEVQTSDLSSGYTLIDLSEETLLPENLTSLPSSTPSSSTTTPSSSQESLSAGFASSSSSGISLLIQTMEPVPEEIAPEKDEENEEEPATQANSSERDKPQEIQPEVSEDDDELFAPLPPFAMPIFSSEPPAAVRQTIPPSMRDWILCSEIGLQLMRPARKQIISCVSCGNDCEDGAGSSSDGGTVFRSTFWRMTTCRAGHRQAHTDTATSQTGLCRSCDKDYVLRVIRGEVMCEHEGCRRLLRVNQQDLEDELWDHSGMWKAFRELIQKHNGYECVIHFDRVEVDDNDATACAPLTAECQHDRNACAPCLKLMCEAAIQGDRLDDLVCPEPQCRQRFTRDTIRQHVSAESLRLYDKKLVFAAMARNPSFRWCRCGYGQLHEVGEAHPEWTCAVCHERHCFVCRDDEVDADGNLCEHLRRANYGRAMARVRDEHERTRLTSEAAAQQRRAAQIAVGRLAVQARENTRGTQMVIATTAKRCPRLGCNAPIQRDEGCAHMTCRRCRTEFCWSCKVIWKVPAGTVMSTFVGNVASTGTLLPLHLTTCPLASQRTIERRHLNTSLYASRWDIDSGYDKALDHDLWLQEDQQ